MALNPRDLLKGYVEISSLPAVQVQLNEAINNPKKSMSDIAKIIREDAGLTARLLRIVNSAFYSFPSKVETISQAVTIVGTQQLGALSLATSVMSMFKGIPGDFVSMDSFWRHSVACGVAARTLATLRRETNTERFFVAGMLHDVGRLVLYTKIPDQSREALLHSNAEDRLLYEAELDMLGFTHAVIGGLLLQTWKLPASLEEVVMYHHNPRGAMRFPVEAALIHVADIVAHAMQYGSSGERFVPPIDEEAWDRLGLPDTILSSTIDLVERQFEDAMNTIGTEKDHD